MSKKSEINLRCAEAEKDRWSEAAEACGDSLSNFIRDSLDAASAFLGKDAEAVAQEQREASVGGKGRKVKASKEDGGSSSKKGCLFDTPRGVKCKACGKVH